MSQIFEFASKASAFALLMLLASPALAVQTSAHGSACVPEDDTRSFARSVVEGYRHTSGIDVICPIFVAEGATELTDADVFVDLPTNGSITCTVVSLTSGGSILDSDQVTRTTDGRVELIPASAPIPVDPSLSNTVVLSCAPSSNTLIRGYTFETDL